MSSQLLKDLMKQSKNLDSKEKLDLIMYLARIAFAGAGLQPAP